MRKSEVCFAWNDQQSCCYSTSSGLLVHGLHVPGGTASRCPASSASIAATARNAFSVLGLSGEASENPLPPIRPVIAFQPLCSHPSKAADGDVTDPPSSEQLRNFSRWLFGGHTSRASVEAPKPNAASRLLSVKPP